MISVGPVTDYLYGLAQQAVTGVTAMGKAAVAVDGWPHILVPAMFAVGATEITPEPSGETTVQRVWDGVGAGRVREDYPIPHVIEVVVPGTAQKLARDTAETIFNNYWTLLRADLTLAGALHGGYIASIDEVTEIPMNAGSEGEPGRRHIIRFNVNCRNVTT